MLTYIDTGGDFTNIKTKEHKLHILCEILHHHTFCCYHSPVFLSSLHSFYRLLLGLLGLDPSINTYWKLKWSALQNVVERCFSNCVDVFSYTSIKCICWH